MLQRSIPFERQGRVFGFAQTGRERGRAAHRVPHGPLAETVFMPFMTDGAGADWIGSWFGTGPERGLALMFTLAGLHRRRRHARRPGLRARTAGSSPSRPRSRVPNPPRPAPAH